MFETRFTPRTKLVWTGDLNVAPTPLDVHNPEKQSRHVCFHEDVQAAFSDVLEWGFVDVFRNHNPEPGHYSFFDYRTPNAAKRGMGWRIDHILATQVMAKTCVSARIDIKPRLGQRPSDHTFVLAEFR